jgi:hypothetical protein
MPTSRFFLSGEPESVTAKALGQVPWAEPSCVDASSSSTKTSPLIQVLDNNDSDNLSLEKETESDSDEPPLLMTSNQKPLQEGAQELPSLMEQMMADAVAVTIMATKEEAKKVLPIKKPKLNSSCGMKKGFLLNSGGMKKKSKTKTTQANRRTASVVVTTPTVSPSRPIDNRVLPVVQEKTMDTNPLDLQETIASNPRLFRALQDPTFVGALDIIQTNPSKAKTIFNENPQLASLFQEFGGVLGLHYSKLGELQQQQQETKPPEEQMKQVSTKNNRDPVQEKVNKILANQELAELLTDPNTQRVMQECGVPGRMQAYMQHPEYGPKLRRLIDAGLLKVA